MGGHWRREVNNSISRDAELVFLLKGPYGASCDFGDLARSFRIVLAVLGGEVAFFAYVLPHLTH